MIMSILQIRELNLIKGSSGYLIVESQTQARMSSKLLFLITIPQGAGEGHRPLKRSTVLSLTVGQGSQGGPCPISTALGF